MTWTCPECQGSMPVLATDSHDEVFECPWCRNQMAAYPEELEIYSDARPTRTVKVKTDDDQPERLVDKLLGVIR